ncbi:root hair defective 3 GTP-binding protein [Auriculariales sp. MPI-PUGE-AT-0066]|nr:root hair defective 3 GTP-binding protein [Auriculariales sp. MPI-PUGE-AT-0066]
MSMNDSSSSLAKPINGTTPAVTERVQVIDDQKQFTTELNTQIERWGLRDAGFGYDVVAVFGSQSTGKSTLLNRLFGTTFDVMDETRRQQTTKGIWMCRAKGLNLMVMDVEGTDGRERGEDQDFERKSALFSLASSEVLLVNMWEHAVGLYQGANMSLLKTVFEVNLGLFGKKTPQGTTQRTLLLFVIRDHVGTTPIENLQATLSADLLKIWDSIAKPSDLASSQLSDYFDLAFTTLPHKILMPEKFEASVIDLRRRFSDRERADYVFKPAYHKRIPADGVAHYMEGIWEQVQSNKDLDLPTQQELLAQFRCDEIAAGALEEFMVQARAQRKPVEAGRAVEALGAMMADWKARALGRFDKDGSRYHQGVYQRKRTDLLASLDSVLGALFLGQLKNLHKAALAQFKRELADGLKGEGYSFADVVAKAREDCEKRFEEGAAEALLPDTDWTYQDELELLREEMDSVAVTCRSDEVKKMVNLIERNFRKQVSEPVEVALNKGNKEMWDQVLRAFKEMLNKAEQSYLAKATTFNCTEEENATALATVRKRAWQALRGKVDEQTADPAILTKLRTHFEERFRYDDNGVPRVWKPADDIDGAFQKARDETVALIPLYARIEPNDAALQFSLPSENDLTQPEGEFDFEETLVVFSESKQLDLTARFRKEADAYYVEAKRSTVSSVAQIPIWMYGVLVVLGWNEAMTVLFNPMLFTFMLMGLAAAWVIVQLNLLGPILHVTRAIGGEVQTQATRRLREHFTEPVAVPAARSLNSTAARLEKEHEEQEK